jgi:hypothetical protein
MIRYDLICERGHEFDGWFRDSEAFEKQAKRKLVACSHCGSENIEKQLMAPGIPAKSNTKSATMVTGAVDPRTQMLMQMMREVRKNVEENSEYVGDKFADQARKMHYSEIEKRGIYGEAKPEEARALIEEGIEVHQLPRLPEDSN